MRSAKEETKMEITKMLTISTAHISRDTARKLSDRAYCQQMDTAVFEKDRYGWWVYCNSVLEDDLGGREWVPDDLWRCMELANKNSCEWLCLDSDAQIIEGLPVYDW